MADLLPSDFPRRCRISFHQTFHRPLSPMLPNFICNLRRLSFTNPYSALTYWDTLNR
ncbi:hypothetical protein SOVF_180010 [Spinacia oleracea]|nr:hypothetical protein SOVF_180010 [Spinacia oleracea]